MALYSEERKEAVLSKLLPSYNMTVAELARQEGISEPPLYTWRNKTKSEARQAQIHSLSCSITA